MFPKQANFIRIDCLGDAKQTPSRIIYLGEFLLMVRILAETMVADFTRYFGTCQNHN